MNSERRSESQLPYCSSGGRRRSVTFADGIEQVDDGRDDDEPASTQPLSSVHALSVCKPFQRYSLSHDHLCVGHRGGNHKEIPFRESLRRSKSFVLTKDSTQDAQAPESASNSFSVQDVTSKCFDNLPEDPNPKGSAYAAASPFRTADASYFPEPFPESPRSSNRKQANTSRLATVLSWKMSRRSSSSSQGILGLENEPGMQDLTRRRSCSNPMVSVGPPYSGSQRSSMANSSTENVFVSRNPAAPRQRPSLTFFSTENAFVSSNAQPTAAHRRSSSMAKSSAEDACASRDALPTSALRRSSSMAESSTEEAFVSQDALPFPAAIIRTQDASCPDDCLALAGSFPPEELSKQPTSRGTTSNKQCWVEGTAALASHSEYRQPTPRTSSTAPQRVEGAAAPTSHSGRRQLTSQTTPHTTSPAPSGRPASASHSKRRQPTSFTAPTTTLTPSHVISGRPKGFAALRASVPLSKVFRPKYGDAPNVPKEKPTDISHN